MWCCRFSLYDHFLCDFFLCLLSNGLLLSRRLSAFCARCHLKWPLFFSLPLHHTFFMSDFPILRICSLFSPLSLFLFLSLIVFFFMGSQWREDGGPGFGHWCGRARWLCQYPWPAGNSSGSTTSQSGAPSWEEVPDNVWERLLCVWGNGVQMKRRKGYDIEGKQDDFRIELEESSFVLQCFRWLTALKCIVPWTYTWNSTRARHPVTEIKMIACYETKCRKNACNAEMSKVIKQCGCWL